MRKRFKTILVALTLFFAVTSVALYANKGFEITYDIFGVHSSYGCENCAANIWNLDVENIYDEPHVVNVQCRICHSEFHFENPVLLSSFLGTN